MMYQCRFINCNKCTTLVGDVDNRGHYTCVVVEDIWQHSVLSPKFFSEPKTVLKKEFLLWMFNVWTRNKNCKLIYIPRSISAYASKNNIKDME